MFALPDYGDYTVPPQRCVPADRIDARCMHNFQKMMAESYMAGRQYWIDHPDEGPNEAQQEVEKFLEFTGLLPKRLVPQVEPEPLSMLLKKHSGSSSSSSSISSDAEPPSPTKSRPRWKRYFTMSSTSSSSESATSVSPPSSPRSIAISLPLIGKVQRPSIPLPKQLRRLSRNIARPVLKRTASEPTNKRSKATPPPKTRRMTMDESQVTLAQSRIGDADRDITGRPLSLQSPPPPFTPRIPRFPCDYLPLPPITPPSPTAQRRRSRPARMSDDKSKPKPKPESLPPTEPITKPDIIVPPPPIESVDYRNPPIGDPNRLRRFSEPPPEWYHEDTPFTDSESELEEEQPTNKIVQVQDEYQDGSITWFQILLAPFALVIFLVYLLLFILVFIIAAILC
ncbi:hypothetical protein C8R42DRAFT_17548 [Lentinula raphanica]|nr:hypothetical protein C8R42DRAFT_17548 [Lentinula raphanica]